MKTLTLAELEDLYSHGELEDMGSLELLALYANATS